MDVTGIPIGIGAGIAIGIAVGRNGILSAIRGYTDANHVELLKGGSPISVEDFLEAATRAQLTGKKAKLAAALLLLGGLALAGVTLYSHR